MTDDAREPTPEERRALFRVVRGTPTDAELAALTVVLLAAARPGGRAAARAVGVERPGRADAAAAPGRARRLAHVGPVPLRPVFPRRDRNDGKNTLNHTLMRPGHSCNGGSLRGCGKYKCRSPRAPATSAITLAGTRNSPLPELSHAPRRFGPPVTRTGIARPAGCCTAEGMVRHDVEVTDRHSSARQHPERGRLATPAPPPAMGAAGPRARAGRDRPGARQPAAAARDRTRDPGGLRAPLGRLLRHHRRLGSAAVTAGLVWCSTVLVGITGGTHRGPLPLLHHHRLHRAVPGLGAVPAERPVHRRQPRRRLDVAAHA